MGVLDKLCRGGEETRSKELEEQQLDSCWIVHQARVLLMG